MDGNETPQPLPDETEVAPNLEQILKAMDNYWGEKEGLKPSQAWEYRERFRSKYQLPETEEITVNPTGFIHKIEAILKDNAVQIRGKHEFQKFFAENPEAHAVNFKASVFREPTIGVGNVPENNFAKLKVRAKDLAHESVHALQGIRYPRMPIEEKEREAYFYELLTPGIILKNKDNPVELFDAIDDLINISVAIHKKTSVTVGTETNL